MNLKLTVAILAIAVVPVCAQAQQPSGAKVKADAQNVVKMISGDKAKTQTYCQLDLGPEYVALANELEEVDPNSQDGQEISLPSNSSIFRDSSSAFLLSLFRIEPG
jgi:hypothetical protein